jgi:hypothetical protein
VRIKWETLREFHQISTNDADMCRLGTKRGPALLTGFSEGVYFFMVRANKHERYFCVRFIE